MVMVVLQYLPLQMLQNYHRSSVVQPVVIDRFYGVRLPQLLEMFRVTPLIIPHLLLKCQDFRCSHKELLGQD